MKSTKRISIMGWLVTAMAVTVVSVSGAVDTPSVGHLDRDPWTLPTWVANDIPIRGALDVGSDVSADAVRIRYQIDDGEAADVEATEVAEQRIKFSFPKLPYDTFGLMRVWAENIKTSDPIGSARTVAIADWREFDISGQTAVELLFPMQSWGMQIRFTPCCLINAGYLKAERVPINPAKSAEGLPKTLASDFLNLAPDPTVVATAGLNADIEIDPESSLADSPENVTVYTWYKGRWIPVIGATLHEETNTIRFKAIEGGYFVLASKRSEEELR